MPANTSHIVTQNDESEANCQTILRAFQNYQIFVNVQGLYPLGMMTQILYMRPEIEKTTRY